MTTINEGESPNITPDSELQVRQVVRGQKPGDQYVRITHHPSFRRVEPGVLIPTEEVDNPSQSRGRVMSRLQRFLFGQPIPTASELLERVGVTRGLAIFASDNISSSAYASEEIMRTLLFASVVALSLTLPITFTILALLAIVILSDFQVIRAYPNGGGSYIVAKENLGVIPGLVAAAALLTDYILTAAVSISAGMTAITSAFPALYPHRVTLALLVISVMTIINLRGIREAGRFFTLPVYIYVFALLGLLALGLSRVATGTLPEYVPPPDWLTAHPEQSLTLILVLRAFASGAVALTGVEAISNGVPAFQPPEVSNARVTLVIMGCLFGTIFLGISFLASQIGIIPDPHEVESVISQVARTLMGVGWYYYLLQLATATLLVLAANTAFNGFPRLASILALDQYLPRQFSYRGDRLAFTGGILLLTALAALLIYLYQASVTGLIPLYTVGVFVAFTLSQAGLVRRWWTRREAEPGWQLRLVINGIGVTATGTVALVVAVSKFALGAWMVLVLMPILVWVMWSIHRHYQRMGHATTPETPLEPEKVHVRIIVPVANTALPVRQALAYALALTTPDRIVAVHVADDEAHAERFKQAWEEAVRQKVPLVVIESPYRSLISPLVAYIEAMRETHPLDTLTIVLPEYVPRHWWEHLLHNQTALRLKAALLFHPGLVVTSVPYHMGE